MNSIRPEDLGSMGESFFNILCKRVGFIANSSKSDDKGWWDFEVEHRQTTDINYSNHSYPVYRVQVKSTSGKSCAKITFGNLLKLIQYNGASFIVLIKYSESISIGNTNPDKVYLLHIDEKFSLSILKEAREKQLKSNEFALNKDKKTISFKNENEIDQLDGIGLKNYIDKCIGGSYLKYTENKLTYLSSFEKEGRKKLSICTMDTMNDAESMANCFLGYPEKFNLLLLLPFMALSKKRTRTRCVVILTNQKYLITLSLVILMTEKGLLKKNQNILNIFLPQKDAKCYLDNKKYGAKNFL